MVQQETHFYEFGRFRLDATERVLLRGRELVPLTPKVFDILLALVEHGGHLVEKDDLMKMVWPDSFVEEGNLTQNVSLLRKALGLARTGLRP
jgi:DNA-binding winged helix-turn-helix (wHTH) protein